MPLRCSRPSIPREVLAVCLVVFLADVLSGIISPTFSLFAAQLGVSLAVLGMLNTVGGLTSLVASLPLGMLSDRVGRRQIMILGMASFALAMIAFSVATGPAALAAGRILFGIGAVGVFQVGAAWIGDITTSQQRPVAFGLYATSMGLGFTVGPLIGGQLSERFGYESAYVVGSLIGTVGVFLVWRVLRGRATVATRRVGSTVGPAPRRASLLQGLRLVIRQRSLMLVTFGNMLVGLSFAGAVVTFFPLYGEQLLISQAAIGTMFSVRAIVSTLGRFPNGILASLFGNQTVMLSALFVQATVMLGIARTTNPTMLTVLLAIEGLAFGAYLVSGQTFVANNTTAETRGTAVGVYSMVSSIGRALSPFGLGLIAQRWGVASVFSVTGWMLGVGFVISVIGTILLARRSLDVQTPAVPDTSG